MACSAHCGFSRNGVATGAAAFHGFIRPGGINRQAANAIRCSFMRGYGGDCVPRAPPSARHQAGPTVKQYDQPTYLPSRIEAGLMGARSSRIRPVPPPPPADCRSGLNAEASGPAWRSLQTMSGLRPERAVQGRVAVGSLSPGVAGGEFAPSSPPGWGVGGEGVAEFGGQFLRCGGEAGG